MDGASAAGTPELEIRLLGPIEVGRDGTLVALGGPKPRALFAALALEPGRVVSVDRLVEAIWPGDPPDSAVHAIQVYVSQLRKTLGPVIATHALGYELQLAPERIDVHRFTRLAQEGRDARASGDPVAAEGATREALALWRGPALADFLYEPFAQNEIARLEELRTVVLEDRVDADLALGRHAELVSELEALVQAQPLRERPRAQLMLALYRSGRQADALAAYRAARETLVEELGIDPGPELRELEAAILRHDESLLLEEAPPARPAMQFRRLVTLLFVDVVESMALAGALDPEALGRVLQSYFETVSAAITRHGGAVEKYAGDAVMAAFGIPVSHEDDALRAARAALDIRVGIAALNEQLVGQHVRLEVRIGIEAGEVVATPTEVRQRLVTGEAVGIAAKLEASAGADEIVVGAVAGRLIDHAARLESLGELEIKGLSRPVGAFRLLELERAAPAFARSLDAPLVGRKRELAALRRSLKRAVDGSAVRVAIVTAPPGVGKSRLAAEFTRRAKVTTLWGRCLPYGEGITYWPLREVLVDAPASAERDGILAALESATPPPAPEIAWLFRRFCEAIAQEQPVVLVFDDVHWAELTFLELVEHLAEKGEGLILVVCLAREELGEERPGFLEGRTNVDRIELESLSVQDTDALLDGLGGAALETDQRTRIAETAEGNPLFLEQLLALALEGGLVATSLPETIQALLAARLDRLGPGERAVLERGAVIGKEFRLDDVTALVDPEAAATTEVHVNALAARGFVRPAASGEFRFRHGLVQEAVYRAAPKRLRAELHERFIDRFESRHEGAADSDEFAGYHLEQAYRLRSELGESDRRTEALGEDAGTRLRDAGVRAMMRGDAAASSGFFRRAMAIPSLSTALACELACELGIVLRGGGDLESALMVLSRAREAAGASGHRNLELRAQLEIGYVRMTLESRTADELLAATEVAIPVFEAAREERLLGRALLLAGWLEGGHLGRHEPRLARAEQALDCFRRSSWPIATAAGEIANALYYGPTPVLDGMARCEALVEAGDLDQYGRANVEVFLGGLIAQTGDFDGARALLSSANATFAELGQTTQASTHSGALSADVEMLAGDAVAAEATLRRLCQELEAAHAYSHLASLAGDLAEVLFVRGRLDEAADWVSIAERHSAPDDIDARMIWMPVAAKLRAHAGAIDEAVALAAEGVMLARTTDASNERAKAQRDQAEVLSIAGHVPDARVAFHEALKLYEEKGNVVGASHLRALLGDTAVLRM
jgi:DNA-binding SARP family transcriptional activator